MPDEHDLPDAIQWHEGMLLAPQHFQQLSVRQEALLHFHTSLSNPFHWGVVRFRYDPVLLVSGRLRVMELEAIMPDGLVVRHDSELDTELAVDLAAPDADAEEAVLTVHVAVPAARGEAGASGQARRYRTSDGPPVADQVSGRGEMRIPRLRPHPRLIVSEELPEKYVGFPLIKIAFQEESYRPTDFIAPMLQVEVDSPLGRMCGEVARLVREKAAFLAEKRESPSLTLPSSMGLETKSVVHALVSALPPLEALLSAGVCHPFSIHLAFCSLVGQVSTLGTSLLPPASPRYDHDDLRATFRTGCDFVHELLDQIVVSYVGIPFVLDRGIFKLELKKSWLRRPLVIGLKVRRGASEKELTAWMNGCLIGSGPRMQMIRANRVRGAGRRRIERAEHLGLVPPPGTLLYQVSPDPEFVEADQTLEILNSGDPEGQLRPAEVLLYVSKNPEVELVEG